MDNVYEKLEIRDYENIDIFVKELNKSYKDINDKYNNIEELFSVIVFGGFDFILSILYKLVNNYKYQAQYIDVNKDESEEDIYILEINKYGLFIENAYYKNEGLKILNLGNDYVETYLQQDDVKQDIVDYSLKYCDETVLFGIGYE